MEPSDLQEALQAVGELAFNVNTPTNKDATRPTKSLIDNVAEDVRQTLRAACWEQWRSIGGLAAAIDPWRARAIVDLEALVLLTLLLRDEERRFDDFLGWFASTGSKMLSVQRTQNLIRRFPDDTKTGLAAFARLAVENGDARWRRFASKTEAEPDLNPRAGKGPAQPAVHSPPALMLRLRTGLGVGTKADLLTFLLGIEGRFATIREAAQALAYSEIAVRATAADMVLAGFLKVEPGPSPARYAASRASWSRLLSFEQTETDSWPAWRNWSQVFAFFVDVLRWRQEGRDYSWSTYVWSSRARTLLEKHLKTLPSSGIDLPGPNVRPGSPYLEVFADSVRQVCSWTRNHL